MVKPNKLKKYPEKASLTFIILVGSRFTIAYKIRLRIGIVINSGTNKIRLAIIMAPKGAFKSDDSKSVIIATKRRAITVIPIRQKEA